MAMIGKVWAETSVTMLCAGDRSSVLSLFAGAWELRSCPEKQTPCEGL